MAILAGLDYETSPMRWYGMSLLKDGLQQRSVKEPVCWPPNT